jgi:hypothetical protein
VSLPDCACMTIQATVTKYETLFLGARRGRLTTISRTLYDNSYHSDITCMTSYIIHHTYTVSHAVDSHSVAVAPDLVPNRILERINV